MSEPTLRAASGAAFPPAGGRSKEKLEALLVEDIQSGEATEMARQDWSDIRAEALRRLEARKPRKSA